VNISDLFTTVEAQRHQPAQSANASSLLKLQEISHRFTLIP